MGQHRRVGAVRPSSSECMLESDDHCAFATSRRQDEQNVGKANISMMLEKLE